MSKFIDVDEAAELSIRCKAGRSFDLTINLNRDLTGKSYKLQVSSTPALTFTLNAGITIVGMTLKLAKSPTDMSIPTGCYRFDLVEIDGQKADNIFYGNFIVEPSITTIL